MDKKIIIKARKVKTLLMDVDGVLSEGSIIYDSEGREIKIFSARDGIGIKWLIRNGIRCAILTGRDSKPVETRAKELGIEPVWQGAKKKLEFFERLVSKKEIVLDETAYMGDDLIDLPIFKRVIFSIAPSDCVEELKDKVDYLCKHPGGKGAIREVAELILKAQGKWQAIFKSYDV